MYGVDVEFVVVIGRRGLWDAAIFMFDVPIATMIGRTEYFIRYR
jgi:hypothetical protein